MKKNDISRLFQSQIQLYADENNNDNSDSNKKNCSNNKAI